jgi:hypothetical protein
MSNHYQVELLLVDAPKAAAMLSMSRSFFYENLATQRIPIKPIRFGKKTLFSVRDLTNFVNSGCKVDWGKS